MLIDHYLSKDSDITGYGKKTAFRLIRGWSCSERGVSL